MTFQIISFQFSNRYFMFLKCLFGIVLYLTESFAQNELAINSVNETSAVISGPNKEVWFPRVINGIPAKLGDVPYQVSNFHKDSYKTTGSANLFDHKYIVAGSVVHNTMKFALLQRLSSKIWNTGTDIG